MGKPTICIGENKDTTRIVQFLFYLNPKFQASSTFLCFYRPVCVGPVRKPHCWFFHEVAQILYYCLLYIYQQLSQIVAFRNVSIIVAKI